MEVRDRTLGRRMTRHSSLKTMRGTGLPALAEGQPEQAGPPWDPRQELIERLQTRISRAETVRRADGGQVVSSGVPAIDDLLPAGGYPRGVLVQWLAEPGCGADELSLRVAREACRGGGALVVVDSQRQFYPPAAVALGLDLGNIVVLQPSATGQDALWALDQALRCPAVAAVWAPCTQIDARWFRRFQLSAESSGCLGLLVQPLAQQRQPTWAEVQWRVEPRAWRPSEVRGAGWQRLGLQLRRCRGTRARQWLELAIDRIDGSVLALAAGGAPGGNRQAGLAVRHA